MLRTGWYPWAADGGHQPNRHSPVFTTSNRQAVRDPGGQTRPFSQLEAFLQLANRLPKLQIHVTDGRIVYLVVNSLALPHLAHRRV